MEKKQLENLLEHMSMREKIGQLILLSGDFFGTDEIATGPKEKLGIEEWVVDYAGSAMNVLGTEKVRNIQEKHMKKSKIPLLFMGDIVYGYKTIFPIPLALASSWNMALIKECAEVVAKEASAAGAHVTFAPMVDVVRDARWGRCMESPGEDPYYNSQFAAAMVNGFQGELKAGESLVSCVKHFAGYGAVEAGREYNTVDMSRWRLMQEYLPPYKAAVDAGCRMVMTSFNTIEGVPVTANRWLLDDILRKTWNFDGVIVTDYAAVQELIAHGVASNDREAAYLSMNAGVDIDMKTPCYANQLQPLCEGGILSIEKIDKAVMRVLTLKNELGLFEDPYQGLDIDREKRYLHCDKHREKAKEAAAASMVLLKNSNNTLPLQKKIKIALIGPYSDSKELNGMWAVHCDRENVVTLKEAFQRKFGASQVRTCRGCELMDDYESLGDFGGFFHIGSILKHSKEEELAKSIELAKWADVVVFAVGEHMLQSGESGSRTKPEIPRVQSAWMDEVLPYAKKSVTLLFNGRPLVVGDIVEKTDAVLECYFPGSDGADSISELVSGEKNPSGRLTMSFPREVGQIPVYYNHFSTGRPQGISEHTGRYVSRYLDCPNEPYFPFGYGLSYHESVYSEITLSSDRLMGEGSIYAKLTIENLTETEGEEVVQLYIHDLFASVVRPVKELKDFQKIKLGAHEKKEVVFEIRREMLQFVDQNYHMVVEPGEFELFIGKNSIACKKAKFFYQE